MKERWFRGRTAAVWLAVGSAIAAMAEAPSNRLPAAIASAEELLACMASQRHATRPDFVVYVPQVTNSALADTGNEHFLVFEGPDGSFMAVWTQSSAEARPDQHIVFARSEDGGRTWSPPKVIAGPARAGEGPMASWAFPLVSRRGRIYVLYSQHIGRYDNFPHHLAGSTDYFAHAHGALWAARGPHRHAAVVGLACVGVRHGRGDSGGWRIFGV